MPLEKEDWKRFMSLRMYTTANSFISPKIDDYNSSVYYENPSYLLESASPAFRRVPLQTYIPVRHKSTR